MMGWEPGTEEHLGSDGVGREPHLLSYLRRACSPSYCEWSSELFPLAPKEKGARGWGSLSWDDSPIAAESCSAGNKGSANLMTHSVCERHWL